MIICRYWEHLKTALYLILKKYCSTIPTIIILNVERWTNKSLSAHMYSATARSPSLQGLREWALSHQSYKIYTPLWQLPDTPSSSVGALQRQTQAYEAVQRNVIETGTWQVLTHWYMDQLTEILKSVVQYNICNWRNVHALHTAHTLQRCGAVLDVKKYTN